MEVRKKKIDNFVYEIGKDKVTEVIQMMNKRYEEVYQEYIEYQNAIFDDDPRFIWFNSDYALKFLRTWKILMNDADPSDRNLVLAYLAYEADYDAILEVFNGSGCDYRSAGSLRILIWAARRNVRNLYEAKYGGKGGLNI